jgi:hypothetical protein
MRPPAPPLIGISVRVTESLIAVKPAVPRRP